MSGRAGVTPAADHLDRIDPAKAAVVVVDMQRDFCAPDGTLARRGKDVSAAEEAVRRTAVLLDGARSAGVPVLFVVTTHSDRTHDITWRYRCGTEDPADICAEGSAGAELFGITSHPGEAVVVKHRYSGFGTPDMEPALAALGRRSLLFCGVATNVCVETTLRDAVCADYAVTLIEDCCAAYSPEAHRAAVRNVEESFGMVVTSDRLLARWFPAKADTATAGAPAASPL